MVKSLENFCQLFVVPTSLLLQVKNISNLSSYRNYISFEYCLWYIYIYQKLDNKMKKTNVIHVILKKIYHSKRLILIDLSRYLVFHCLFNGKLNFNTILYQFEIISSNPSLPGIDKNVKVSWTKKTCFCWTVPHPLLSTTQQKWELCHVILCNYSNFQFMDTWKFSSINILW